VDARSVKIKFDESPRGAFHLTIKFEVERGRLTPMKVKPSHMQVRIFHSANAFFAPISTLMGLKGLLWKTMSFLPFHMLHNNTTTLLMIFGLAVQ